MSITENSFTRDTDSEPNSSDDEDVGPESNHYQPISATVGDEDEEEEEESTDQEDILPDENPNNSRHYCHSGLPNGHLNHHLEEENESEAEEEERRRAASESAIQRAFREDESRRSAPLPAENASRVRDAMRGISFPGGSTPDWAQQLSEGQWIDQLRRLRQQPHPTATALTPNSN